MRSSLWAAHAELRNFDPAKRCVGAKGYFHETIEIDRRVDAAHLAMNGVTNFAQRTVGLVYAAAKRTEQVPLQIQQSGARSS